MHFEWLLPQMPGWCYNDLIFKRGGGIMCKDASGGYSNRNLLLGNGINAYLGINKMTRDEIAKRFYTALMREKKFFSLLLNVSLDNDLHQRFVAAQENGIESLADIVYELALEQISDPSINQKIRLLATIICCAMSAIFYDEHGKNLGIEIEKREVPFLSRYNNIFTLNYVEFWDKKGESIHLHGKYCIEKTGGEKPFLHYSSDQWQIETYKALVNSMENSYYMKELNTHSIVFSPAFYTKSEMIALGTRPAQNLFPGKDIILHSVPKLYHEFADRNIRQIEVFGMSPSGDDELIRVFNKMDAVIVYIYGYNERNKNDGRHAVRNAAEEEVRLWEGKLTCPHVFLDSLEIENARTVGDIQKKVLYRKKQ